MEIEQGHKDNIQWAVIDLMGHGQAAGMIKPSDIGGLLRVDVPIDDGYRTEYYGPQAIYSIRIVSEEIARAYAIPDRELRAYDAPIVPRRDYEEALQRARDHSRVLENQITVLHDRLTRVNALPESKEIIEPKMNLKDPLIGIAYTDEEGFADTDDYKLKNL